QSFFWQGINDLIGVLAAIQKMRNDHIMGVIVFLIMNKPLEKSEIVIINIEVDRCHFAQRATKYIVYNFLVRDQFIEQQKYFQMLAYFGILYKIPFARYRAQYADLL